MQGRPLCGQVVSGIGWASREPRPQRDPRPKTPPFTHPARPARACPLGRTALHRAVRSGSWQKAKEVHVGLVLLSAPIKRRGAHCARPVRKVGYFRTVFPNDQGDCGNYCVPIHRTARASAILLWQGGGVPSQKSHLVGEGVAWDWRKGCRCFEARQWLNWVLMCVVVVQPAIFVSAMNSETSQK